VLSTAIVTGGTRGIGAAIAASLAGKGYFVVAAGLHPFERADAEQNSNIRAELLDVTCARSVYDLVAGLDRIDLIVNCAGIIQRDGREFTIAGFRTTLEVNLVGTMQMCLAAKSKLSESRGSIINLASMLTFFGSASAPAYAASKGGIGQLTKSLALAWAADGIRVNAVAPGWISTDMTDPLQHSPERSAAIIDRTPLSRWGAADDVCGLVAFLASKDAAFVTGAIVPVDGGYLAA
jgi:NAD(P)-dependent dehydrogenase (short-subunit alcohol dehydrogenase family)